MTKATRVYITPPTSTSPTRRAFINTIAANATSAFARSRSIELTGDVLMAFASCFISASTEESASSALRAPERSQLSRNAVHDLRRIKSLRLARHEARAPIG